MSTGTKFGTGQLISGGFGDVLDLTGKQAGATAIEAARLQLESTREGIAEQRRAREQARGDLQPFRQAGEESLSGLSQLITSPDAQRDFVQNNDLLDFITKDAETRLGAVQSGDTNLNQTNQALQNSLTLLAPDLINQSIGQRANLATLGANAAAQQATETLGTGRSIADLFTQGANAQAAGVVGQQNARTNARNQAAAGVSAFFT